jgi:hypothetical protein
MAHQGYVGTLRDKDLLELLTILGQWQDRRWAIRTIQLLERWIRKYFKSSDLAPIEKMDKAFCTVRQLQQKPAHAIDKDRFE